MLPAATLAVGGVTAIETNVGVAGGGAGVGAGVSELELPPPPQPASTTIVLKMVAIKGLNTDRRLEVFIVFLALEEEVVA